LHHTASSGAEQLALVGQFLMVGLMRDLSQVCANMESKNNDWTANKLSISWCRAWRRSCSERGWSGGGL